MNKKITSSAIIVVLLGFTLWWSALHMKSGDSVATPTASVSQTPLPSPAITITSPKPNDIVNSPILVTGTARVFENQFTVQIKDSTGKIVATAHVFSDAQDAGLYGNYSVKLAIPQGSGTDFKIEALSYSPKGDDSFEGYASVMVKLKTTQ